MSIISHIGKPGSFSHMAARAKYGSSHTYLPCRTFADVYKSVTEGHSEIGVIPLENSLAGSIYENYDLFGKYPVQIIAEQYLKVEHYLLAKKSEKSAEEKIKDLKIVYSHPKALEQCQSFFDDHPWITPKAADDTASACAMVASSNDPNIAAIGGDESAHLYRLQTLVEHIEDDKYNFTRFVYISKSNIKNQNANKCSLEIELAHEPGSLVTVLQVLGKHKLNMTKLESRPIMGKPFEYMFYLDFEYQDNAMYEKALDEMRRVSHKIQVLGIYQAGSITDDNSSVIQ
ncbi:MAG: prephenate dehydratase domain-containing protein [Patescibacteria group bacterium]